MTEQVNVLFALDAPRDLRDHLEKALANNPEVRLSFPAGAPDRDGLVSLAPGADVIVGWRVDPEVLDAATRLRLFIFGGVGAQGMLAPIRELNERQPVTLVKCVANTYATAQHAVALLLALTNRVIPHHNWMVAGHWRRGDDYAASTILRDRRIGLLGYGDVNRKVHRFLAPFDVSFAVLSRSGEMDPQWLPRMAENYHGGQLNEFLEAVDILFTGVPLTDETRGLIGRPELELLGPRGLLVNIARGPVIDEQALYEALRDRTIAGAAIDVWYQYRPEPDEQGHLRPTDYPFHELDNVVLSPHRAASPVFDLRRWDEVVEHIQRFAHGESAVNVVDLERGY